MAMRSLVLTVMLVVFVAGTAEAQTTVSPSDIREIVRTYSSTTTGYGSVTGTSSTFLSVSTWIRYPSSVFEARLFFEFDLSGYASAGAAVFKFSASAFANASGQFYLQPMTSGEDGTVTTGDFSLLGSPIWTGTMTSSSQSFSVPVTSWFNARAGGFAGFALVAAPGTAGNRVNGTGTINYTPVPEPGTFALFGLGLGSLFVAHRVRRRRKQK